VRRLWLIGSATAAVVLTIVLSVSCGRFARLLPGGGRPDVLLISIDTLRADRLGSYGYAAAQTPALDGLAANGLRFAQAATVTPLTLPAHTSLLTGTFPTFHGVRDNGQFYVSDDLTTLAEVFKANGYRTGGFIGAFVLDRRWGIAQGFDTYFDDFDLSKYQLGAGIDAAQRPGREVVDHALEWLRQSSSRPFFAWVHLYDPHSPYDAPEPVAERFPRTVSGAYDAEVAEADIQVARLLAGLRELGVLDRTLIVVVGDHGESLGEHQEQQHGFFVYDATTRIPLIISGPRVPARVVPEQVRITDVMPTILDLCRMPAPAAVQGVTLAAAARGGRLDLLALSESWYPRYHYGWSELTAVRDGRYKFIAAPRRELYDTQTDPGETHDLSSENPRLADALERALQDLTGRTAAGAAPQSPQDVDSDVEERLRALGYVGGSVSPRTLEARQRGDPKDKIVLYNLLKQAGTDSVSGRIDDAIAKVGRVLAEDPTVVEAYIILGNLHAKAKRPDAAIAAYQKALALDDRNENAAFALALAYKQSGQLDAAQAGFERVLQMNARSTKAAWQLADIAARRRDFARAEVLLTGALARNVDRPPFLLKLAEAQIERSRHDEAEKNLREALRLKPDLVMAHYDLGLIAEAKNDNDRAVQEYQTELDHHPTVYQAHFNLAKLMSRAGRTADAVDHFRAAVSANHAFAAGYLYLAKSLLDAGALKESEEAALAGLAANPDGELRPLGHFVLADVYSRMGRTRDAARQVALGRRFERGTE
jgi:arylsulfatase A-like enzyme/lipopolysaccharide biosynthesis regulator YciM